MRLVTFSAGPAGDARAGVRVGHRVLDIESASRVKGEPLPSTVRGLLAAGRGALSRVRALAKAAVTEAGSFSHAMHEERAVRLLAPVPDGAVVRDAAAVPGGGAAIVFVIGRHARAIGVDEALDHVAGITLLLDLRDGPVVGPEIVTMDEIGEPAELAIAWSVNGTLLARSNAAAAFDRFPAFLSRSTHESAAEPGDLFAEAVPLVPAPAGGLPAAMRPGDVIECAIEGVAALRVTINGS
jgi:2-keto-4-pentenoate hydratase/2-oxohepta-3-ene-1,7-dioic acid hydratase in catechol pathway